jgi:hypothetical protein
LTERRKEIVQIKKKNWDKKGDITTNTNKIQRIIRDYFEYPYPDKLDNLEEVDTFLDVLTY